MDVVDDATYIKEYLSPRWRTLNAVQVKGDVVFVLML